MDGEISRLPEDLTENILPLGNMVSSKCVAIPTQRL